MALDRRWHKRQTIHPDVYVDLSSNNAGWLSNISEGGVALHMFFPLVTGQAVRLAFHIPGSNHLIEGNCQIAWIDNSRRNAGLQFLDLSETSQQRIREWLSVPTPSLGSRLAGLFVGAVVLSGLIFAFLYMLDLAESSSKSRPAANIDAQTVLPSNSPGPLVKPPDKPGGDSRLNAAVIPKGSVMLQVAAVTQENDALAMVEALRKKNFPAFVLRPSADRYYRVEVGPYADRESAHLAKRGLEKEGFKTVVRRAGLWTRDSQSGKRSSVPDGA